MWDDECNVCGSDQFPDHYRLYRINQESDMVRRLDLQQGQIANPEQVTTTVKKLSLPSNSTTANNEIKIKTDGPKTPKVLEIPGSVKMADADLYIEAASKISPDVAADPKFRTVIAHLSLMQPLEWIKWGESNLTPINTSTDVLIEINRRMNTINASKWVREAIEESSKGKSFFNLGKNNPDYFDAMLKKSRAELESLISSVNSAKESVYDVQQALIIETVAFQVFTSNVSDNMGSNIAANRLKTLMSGRQTAEIFLQTCENTLHTIVKLIQDIDRVLNVTIPAWKIANSKR